MSTKISLTYFGMPGEGATVKEAKADAGRKLEQFVEEALVTPTILSFRGQAALVWRDPYGWSSALLTTDGGLVGRSLCPCSGYADKDDVLASAMRHLAQLAWRHDVANDAVYAQEAMAALPLFSRQQFKPRDLVDYFAWQRRYKAAHDAGASDTEAHKCASYDRPYEAKAAA